MKLITFITTLLFSLTALADLDCDQSSMLDPKQDKLLKQYYCFNSRSELCLGKSIRAEFVTGQAGVVYYAVGGDFKMGYDQFWVFEEKSKEESGIVQETEDDIVIEKTTPPFLYDKLHRMKYSFLLDKNRLTAKIKIQRSKVPVAGLVWNTLAEETYQCRVIKD